MEQYNVTGMSCAACSARVEKAVNGVPGVTSCSVSLLTNSMGVEGTADSATVIEAVVNAGYGASLKKNREMGSSASAKEDELKDTETPVLVKRLIASVAILVPLMYESMGHMLWDWPLPFFLNGNHIGMGMYEMLLTIAIMVINRKFFVSGFKGLIHKSPNMDTLVALGAGAAFGYSLFSLFAMTYYMSIGEMAKGAGFMNEFYFESAATILTLITVGKTLEARSKGRTTDALKSLMRLAPKTAVIVENSQEKEIPVEDVNVGDVCIVKPGEAIPVDGVIVEGSAAVDEAALTGESIPVDKNVGDRVSAATINKSGFIKVRASRVGEDTTLSQIIEMVSDAAATKAPIAKIADRVSGVFVPAVIGIAFVTFIIWMIVGESVGFSLARAISVLVISCPCALGLATPVAIMVGNGVGAKNGILFKTASSLEETGRIQIVALDKTGTITKGQPEVTAVLPAKDITEEELLNLAYSLEIKSEHPLATAIVNEGNSRNIEALCTDNFKVESGNGLTAELDGKVLRGGKKEYISKYVVVDGKVKELAEEASSRGNTPLYFSLDNRFIGAIMVADAIKEDSSDAIDRLKNMGIHVVMITGDNEQTAASIGAESGVNEVVAGVLPNGKAEVISELKKYGKVAMVGDGINDAPALTTADIGIAIGAGTDVAIDAADVVLMKSNLSDAAAAISLSRKTLTNIHENLFWAFFYNVLGIPLAAGAYIYLFGLTLNPMVGAAAMGLSSFCVVSNALRLNLVKIYNKERDRKLKNRVGDEPLLTEYLNKRKEKNNMEINVKGMMCGHCEMHVKKALEKIDGIVEATPSHTTGVVAIKVEKEIDMALVKAAIEDAGYELV